MGSRLSKTVSFSWTISEVYSKPFETSKMERFMEIVNDFYLLTILVRLSILHIWGGLEYASVHH